ncbi:NAD(P)-binding protein [Athelia psychrophila]|uniref:NAD(P)-binding protein n=1 Tax=Athelia psychrophila TaxID=1759441 RepID=A0A166CN21_9AGAM|nr:NAD(P)-binding protein [Fibularhizoctonia sp. CBS 109695]
MASALALNGAKVYIAARKEAALKETTNELNGKGADVHYIVANLADKAGCDGLISEFKKRESKLDILVNNSGITWGGPYNDFPEAKGWDNVMAVNVKSIFYVTAGLTELLAKDSTSYNPAHVINISSTASVSGAAEGGLSAAGNGTWSYGISKAAANHLTTTLSTHLVKRNVMVNAILPGVFPSKMTAFGLKTHGSALTERQPTGRVGIPQDLAGITLFLSSPASAHVTGALILLDGGASHKL